MWIVCGYMRVYVGFVFMNKNILMGIIIIIVVGAVVGIVGMFALSFSEKTTQIDCKFLNGTVQGVVVEDNGSDSSLGWDLMYHDAENGVYYDLVMADSFDFTKELVVSAGNAENIVIKEYGGVVWEIYYLKHNSGNIWYKLSQNMLTAKLSGYLCFASGENGDYFIAIRSGSVYSNNSMDSDLFKNYVEPLVNNITLKDPQNPPKEYQILDLTKEDYDITYSYIKQKGWKIVDNMYVYVILMIYVL